MSGTDGDGHSHGPRVGSAGAHYQRPLTIAFTLTAGYMLVEAAGGIIFNSLALLSDAAHMGTDVLGLGLALAAIQLAKRPAAKRRTYGTYRLEVLAAVINGILLFGVAFYVLYEAVQRFRDPPEVAGLPMMIVAIIGLLINIISFTLLSRGSKESLNIKGAYLEVLSDMLGSIGVIVGGLIIVLTGFRYTDAIVAAVIGLFILPRTWTLMKHALRIIMEIAPPGTDIDGISARIAEVPGVERVHDLHIWTVTSGMDAATVHVVVSDDADWPAVLAGVRDVLAAESAVVHPTIQLEPSGYVDITTEF